MSTATGTMADLLQYVIDDDRASLFVALPGRVEAYDSSKQVADIKPMTKRVARDGDDNRLVDELPVIPAVPVVWPRGAGYFICFPLGAGDEGLIVCCDSDLGAWRDSSLISDPGDERRHSLAGAVFLPGLASVKHILAAGDAGTGHAVFGKESGPQIHIDGSHVDLGAAGGNFVALANLVTSRLNTIQAAFDSHTHLYSPGPGGPAPTAPPPTPIGTLGPVAATIARAT